MMNFLVVLAAEGKQTKNVCVCVCVCVSDSTNGGRGASAAAVSEASKAIPPPQPKGVVSLANTEVFAAILFTEFLKELAAIAQEHSILSYIPMEE